MSTLKQFLYDKSNKSEVDQYFEDQARFLIEKQKLETIDNFNGYFDFLNNEFPCSVYYDGLLYKSVSHAYQAARSSEQHIREKIVRADTIMEMYEIASKIEDPPEWNKNRLKVMETLIRDKFRRNGELREKLKATEKRNLVNSYADATTSNLFWGMVDGKGQNQIGRILESVRNDIHQNMELEKWIFMTFKLEDNWNMLPEIELEVVKADGNNEKIKFEKKSHYFMGKLVGSDVLMTHQSISRRHAVIICDSAMGVCLLDIGSKAGSFLNGKKLDSCIPFRLKPGDLLHFGGSTRKYKLSYNYDDADKYINKKTKEMKKQFDQMEALNNPNANPNALKASLGVIVNDQIFVAGLPENAPIKDVQKFFEQFGEVKNVWIPLDKKTGKTKTFAIITFVNPKDCEKAIDQDGVSFKERKLKIRWAEKRNDHDDRDRDRHDKVDRSRRDKYAEDIKGQRDRVDRDVDRRNRRRSRSPRDSRRRRDDDRRDRRRDRSRSRERERSKDKERRRKRRSKSRSRSSSIEKREKSESYDKDKEKNKEKRREKERDEREKEDVKDEMKTDKKKNKEEVERPKKKSRSPSGSESRSRSRSKSKDQRKKNGSHKKNRDDNREKRDEKRRDKEKERKKKQESESESSSDSGSESDSSKESDSEKEK